MYIKNIVLSALSSLSLFSASTSSIFADPIDWCDEGSNAPNCREKGPFDVTQSDYNLGIDVSNDFDEGRFNFSVESYVSTNLWAHIRGWTNLAQEMTDWEYHRELQQVFDYAEFKNLDSTDYIAYALVHDVKLKVTIDGTVYNINDTDLISGTDWDNNGKIDSLEALPGIKHTVSLVE